MKHDEKWLEHRCLQDMVCIIQGYEDIFSERWKTKTNNAHLCDIWLCCHRVCISVADFSWKIDCQFNYGSSSNKLPLNSV